MKVAGSWGWRTVGGEAGGGRAQSQKLDILQIDGRHFQEGRG